MGRAEGHLHTFLALIIGLGVLHLQCNPLDPRKLAAVTHWMVRCLDAH
jgi:hypothetical protein